MNAKPAKINDFPSYSDSKSIPWGAILIGTVVAIGLSFLFNLFCTSIGLSVIPTSKEGGTALAIGGLIGLLISIIVTMFLAGMTTGYLARSFCLTSKAGILYGFITWSLALILTVILSMQMIQFITSYTDYIYGRSPAANAVNNATSLSMNHMNNLSDSSPNTTEDAKKMSNNVKYGAFIIFILFLSGALSSCIGGYFGVGFNKYYGIKYPEKSR